MSEVGLEQLEKRIGGVHLKQRLELESDHEAGIFGLRKNFFHIENWYSIHSVIRNTLRLCGLHGRGKRNARDIRVRHNAIPIERLPRAFDGYTILHISDLHLDMNPAVTSALIGQVRRTDCDLCVLTGDFRARTFGAFDVSLDLLGDVRSHLHAPVYAVLGNHDSIRMVSGIEAMGIRVLLNESDVIRQNGELIYIAGVDDPHYYGADRLDKAADGIPQEEISILLSHSPEIFRQVAHAGFDVMLCGHTHGGQICLPGGFPIMCKASCPRKMCSGPWTHHQLTGYTSVGAGVCLVDVRLNCPAEITLHHLRST